MSIRAKQKSKELVMIRTGGPLETSFVLNYLNNMKRMPEKMRPVVSVKDMRGREIELPKPPEAPKMDLKPRVETPITIKPGDAEKGNVASGQVVTVVGGNPIPGNVSSGQVVHVAPQGPTISIVPPGEAPLQEKPSFDKDVKKIAEGIAIGKAADEVQKMVEEKKEC